MRPTDTTLSRPLQADEARLLAAVWKMSPWEQERLAHFVIRMVDHDPEAEALAELCIAGKITRRQLLELL